MAFRRGLAGTGASGGAGVGAVSSFDSAIAAAAAEAVAARLKVGGRHFHDLQQIDVRRKGAAALVADEGVPVALVYLLHHP